MADVSNQGGAVYTATNIRLTFRQRLDYTICEFGYNATYVWVSAFMLIFYTDTIGVPAAAVSLLTLVVRIFDAFNDPLIGSLADRTKSRWGRYRPWILCGNVTMCGLMIVLFSAQPGWADNTKLVFMWVVYILVTVASTCGNMPFGAMNGVLTSDGAERAKISGLRMVFANVGGNFTPLIAPVMILAFSGVSGGPEAAPGYFWGVVICAAFSAPLFVYSATHIREVVKPSPKQTSIPLKKQFAAFFRNRYAILIALGFFVIGFCAYGRMGIITYYFTYVGGDIGLMSIYGILGMICAIIGSGFLSVWLYNLLQHKGRVMMVSGGVGAAFAYLMYFVRPDNVMFWIFFFISQLFFSSASAMAYGIVGDAADVGEYRTGIRVDGFIASFVSLLMKAGGAVGPAVMLAIIAVQGYVPNQEQNPTVLNTLNICVTVVTGICLTGMVVLFMFYDMNAKKHSDIRAEIDARHQKDYEELNAKEDGPDA
jgi:sugar (glycoside-pentoside-hexuronide) transporter